MADWVDIDNSTIEPDAPLISSTMFALRDNPKAIAEGAAGAPRVENDAIEPPTPGSIVGHRFSSGSTESIANWATVGVCHIARSGAVRFSIRAQKSPASPGGKVRVLKNNSTIQEFDFVSESLQTFEVDFSVNSADVIESQVINNVTNSGTSTARDAVLKVIKPVPVFAYNVP